MRDKKEMLAAEIIGDQVYLWSLRFRETFLTPEEIEILSSEYLDDLESEGVTPRQFKWAARHVSKWCRYFPKMADLLDAVGKYRANPPKSDQTAIAYDPAPELTPEQEESGKIAAEAAIYAVANKITFEEAMNKVAIQKKYQKGCDGTAEPHP